MSFLKNLQEKAANTAQAIGSKSQEMLEIGKLKLQISQLEGDIKKQKFEIGELVYDAFSKSTEIEPEPILKLNGEIAAKYAEIEEIKLKMQQIQG